MIPERVFKLLSLCDDPHRAVFPVTEVFNEGWMLRLLLDAVQTHDVRDHPLHLMKGARWYSEARLSSPFLRVSGSDPLAEGFTNVDAVIGHFSFRSDTKAGVRLDSNPQQFVVVEAKLYSNLSMRTSNAPGYHQAARNVACMAHAIAETGRSASDFASLAFFVIGPSPSSRRGRVMNLEACMQPESIRAAVRQRIAAYEAEAHRSAKQLLAWESATLLPLVDHLIGTGKLACLSWEDCIDGVERAHGDTGIMLRDFYQNCLAFA